MIDVDWNPDRKTLRQFGWVALFGFGLIGALVAWRTGAFSGSGRWTAAGVLWTLAIACPVLSIARPELLRFIYLPLMAIALPIGLVVGTLLLLLTFVLIFTPLALWFRVIRRDELHLSPDPDASTYWRPAESGRTPESYYRQF